MCISRATSKLCAQEICTLDIFRNRPGQGWTEGSEQSSESGPDIDGGACVVSLYLFLLTGVATYKQFFMFVITAPIDLAEGHFDSTRWVARI